MQREDRYRNVRLASITGALVLGLAAWLVLMASAPRYSNNPDDMGHGSELLWLLALVAFVGGFALPRIRRQIVLAAVVPSLLLAPWTAPRGDDDGLWVFIVPTLAVWLFVCLGLSYLGMRVRALLHGRALRPRP